MGRGTRVAFARVRRAFAAPSPYRPVFAHRLLRRILAGIGISSLGDGLSSVAISWLVLQLTPIGNHGLWVAVAVASYSLPGALGAFILAPWMSRRNGAQLASWDASLRAGALLLIPLAHVLEVLTPGLLVALLAISSLLNAWGKSGRYVLLAELLPVEHRLAGNAVVNTVLELAYVAGPALAALLLVFMHPSLVIGVDALTFLAMAAIFRFGLPARVRAKPVEASADARAAGFSVIRRSRVSAVLVAVSFLFFLFFGPVLVAVPVYVADTLAASAGTLAGYFTAFGVGGFLGAFGAGYLRRLPVLRASLVSVFGVGVCLLPLATPIPPQLAWISFGIAGLFWGPFPSTTTAYFQNSQKGRDLAAVLAARSALQVFALPAGALLAGPVIAALGAQTTILISGFLIIVLAVVAGAAVGALGRRLDAPPTTSAEGSTRRRT